MFGLSTLMLVGALSGSPVKLADVEGRTTWVPSKGRPSVVIFVSHDCPICNAYCPELIRIEKTYHNRIGFSLVYTEPRITPAVAKSHSQSFRMNSFRLLLDPSARLANGIHAKVTPEAALFDAAGRLTYLGRVDDRYLSFGKVNSSPGTHDLRRAIDAVLNHQAPKPADGPPVGCFIVFPHST